MTSPLQGEGRRFNSGRVHHLHFQSSVVGFPHPSDVEMCRLYSSRISPRNGWEEIIILFLRFSFHPSPFSDIRGHVSTTIPIALRYRWFASLLLNIVSVLGDSTDSWSRGYDVAFTRRRSPVQIRLGPPYLLNIPITVSHPSRNAYCTRL